MTFSPSRRPTNQSYLHRKQSYTYNRAQTINPLNYSQYSPPIHSPKLNQQSQYTKLNNVALIEQLKTKLDTALRHNSHLLNQNAALSQMANNFKMELDIRIRKQQNQSIKINKQFTITIEQLKQQLLIKQNQTIKLIQQISKLHQQCYKIQLLKNNQIKSISENHQKQLAAQIYNIKQTNLNNKQLLQLQIKKITQSAELKNYQFDIIKMQLKSENDRLRIQIDQTRNQLKHFNQLKQLQLRQLTQKYKQLITTTNKHQQRQTTIAISKLQNKIKKLKQELSNKNIQIAQTAQKSAVNLQQCQLQIQYLQNQKQKLLQEINDLETNNKQNMAKQKQKNRQLCQIQIKNLEYFVQNQKDSLKKQINKLLNICQSKTQQIKKLYDNLTTMKNAYSTQKLQNEKLIQQLRKRIKKLQDQNLQQIQLLKIKMAQLHQADITNLQHYYQNQLALTVRQLKQLKDLRQQDRQKIHKALQDNDLLRKTFQTQITKYKAKIQDYKIKFASANLQYRQQITSLGTKMQLTSQTLLRQVQHKQKGNQFFQNQKKKFYLLIQGKDKQISAAYQTIHRMKQFHTQQIQSLKNQIGGLRDNLMDKINQLRNIRKQLQDQFQRKSQKIIQQRYQTPNDTLAKQNKQLKDHIQLLQKQMLIKTKQLQLLHRQIKSLQQELGLRAGFIQTIQLQSSAAIEDQRSKYKVIINQNQLAMKDYYQNKLANKNKDITGLQHQLHQKQNDIRQLIVKYNQLQKRLKQLLQSQDRLTELEKKIVNMGLDQNLVKNMSELFAKYKK